MKKDDFLARPRVVGYFVGRPVVYGVFLLLAVTWTLVAGKDIPWDAVHYHVYAGFSAVHDRLSIDFYPAGPQTYINPYAHLPFYLMVEAAWPSMAVGVALACFHSVMLWMTYELARAVQPLDGPAAWVVAPAATLLALVNPVLLQELGSSFTDITTGSLALGGYVALVRAIRQGRLMLVAVGGGLLGAASALKLSNAFLALIPALPLVLGFSLSNRERLRGLFVFACGATLVAMVIALPWAWRLERAFGNPLFPMLNEVFAGPAGMQKVQVSMPTSHANPLDAVVRLFNAMRDPRFLPSSAAEALLRPVDMLRSSPLVHTETKAPDVRYVAILLLPFVAGLVWVFGNRRSKRVAAEAPSDRAFACLVVSFLFGWTVWMSISGNSRYFLPMACIAGVIVVVGLQRIFSQIRPLAYSLALVFGVQGIMLLLATDFRWSPHPWEGPWIQPVIPARFKEEPYVYLPMDSQSQSFLVPWLAPGSSMLGLNSGISPEGRDGPRALALMSANQSRLRTLKLVERITSDGRPVAPQPGTFDFSLRRFGLRVDPTDCEYLAYKGNANVIEESGPKSGPRDRVFIQTCRVLPGGGGLTEEEVVRKREVDIVLNRVEERCPDYFQPQQGASVRSGGIWRRNYGDLALWVNDDGYVRFADLIRGGGNISGLGRIEKWLESPQDLVCWREGGLVHVEPSKH